MPLDATILATVPEAVRGHEALKDVKDVGDLASRFVSEVSKPFAERLPEKLRADPNFKDIKSLDALADSFVNAQKMLGGPRDKVVRVPDDDKDEAGWNQVFSRLGRPESHDKYVLKPPQGKQFSDDDKAFQGAMLPHFHKAGLTQRQLDIVRAGYDDYATKVMSDIEGATNTRVAQARETLKTEWGAAFDKKLAAGETAIARFEQQLKLPGLSAELKASGINNFPAIVKLFAHLGEGMGEDALIGRGGGGGADGVKSPAEAKQEINSLRGDEKFMAGYQDKAHPGHKDAVERMRVLHEQAYPG